MNENRRERVNRNQPYIRGRRCLVYARPVARVYGIKSTITITDSHVTQLNQAVVANSSLYAYTVCGMQVKR